MPQRPRSKGSILCLAFLLLAGLPSPGRAWWEKGHRIIAANAVAVLPDDVPRFFRDGAATLVRMSVQPDKWKGFGTELRHAETPEHYLDLEKLTDDPMKLKFYPDRYGAIEAIFAMHETPGGVGLLPYRLIEGYQKLRGVFAQYRHDPKNGAIRQEILVCAGWLGHYAGDTSQPLHLTIHFDGRVDKSGRVTSNKGIHARFEGRFVDRFIERAGCRPYVRAPIVFPDLHRAIREAFAVSYATLDEVYRLDDAGELTDPDEEAKTFVRRRLAHGSSFLAGLWYTAWKESERIPPRR